MGNIVTVKRFVITASILILVTIIWSRFVMPSSANLLRAVAIEVPYQAFIVVTGSVVARNDVVLTFEESGTVNRIAHVAGDRVGVNDPIIFLSSEQLVAELSEQKAILKKDLAELDSLIEGPSTEVRAKTEAATHVAQQRLINSARIAFARANQTAGSIEGSIRRDIDVWYYNPSTRPRLRIDISTLQAGRLQEARAAIETVLRSWRGWEGASGDSAERVSTTLKQFVKDLYRVDTLWLQLFDEFITLRELNTTYEEVFAVITNTRFTILEGITQTVQDLNTIEQEKLEYAQAVREAAEVYAGATTKTRIAKRADVESQRERVRQLQLRVNDTTIKAPFPALIGEVFVKIGEQVAPTAQAVRVTSQGGYEVSVDITEIDIQNVSIGQKMQGYVEALDHEVSMRVRTINVTEGRINQVPVYTVIFDVLSDEVVTLRSGLTIDVSIPAGEASAAISIPRRSVRTKDGVSTVLVERSEGNESIPVIIISNTEEDMIIVQGSLTKGDTILYDDTDVSSN